MTGRIRRTACIVLLLLLIHAAAAVAHVELVYLFDPHLDDFPYKIDYFVERAVIMMTACAMTATFIWTVFLLGRPRRFGEMWARLRRVGGATPTRRDAAFACLVGATAIMMVTTYLARVECGLSRTCDYALWASAPCISALWTVWVVIYARPRQAGTS